MISTSHRIPTKRFNWPPPGAGWDSGDDDDDDDDDESNGKPRWLVLLSMWLMSVVAGFIGSSMLYAILSLIFSW